MCNKCEERNCLEQQKKNEINDNMTLVVLPFFYLIISPLVAIAFGFISFVIITMVMVCIPMFGIPYLNKRTERKFQEIGE